MWRIDQTQASLSASGLSARVNLQQPDLGIADIVWQGTPIPGARLLQVRRPRSDVGQHLVDAYVRGTDLIAVYESRLEWSGGDTAVLALRRTRGSVRCGHRADRFRADGTAGRRPRIGFDQRVALQSSCFRRPTATRRALLASACRRSRRTGLAAAQAWDSFFIALARCPAAILKWCTLRTSAPWNSGRDRIPKTCDRGSSCSRNGWKKA